MISAVVRVLGPVQVQVGGVDLQLGGARQRALVAVLALHGGRVVPRDVLVRAVWGDDADDHAHRLQQLVSTVRRAIEPGGADGEPQVLVTSGPGYLLHAAVDADDADRQLQAAGAARAAGAWAEVDEILAPVLDRWCAPALADVRTTPWFEASGVRLDERRVDAAELRAEALLELDRCDAALDVLDPLVADHPFRESLRAKQMLALYRRDRQADALAVFRSTREALVDGLGIEPGDALADLESRILRQDPALRASSSAVTSTADPFGATVRTDAPVGPHLRWPDGRSEVLVVGENVIGRHPTASIRIDDGRVSRLHARIERVGERCTIADLGSTNGTTVNSVPADGVALAVGDVVGIGSIMLVFVGPRTDGAADGPTA